MKDNWGRDVHENYEQVRASLLALSRTSPATGEPDLIAAVLDVGFALGTATLVAMPDGTTAMYTSGGGAILGAGEQAHVAAAAQVYVNETKTALPDLVRGDDSDLPAPDVVILRALTHGAAYSASVPVEQLRSGTHPLSRAYAASQLVVTAVREVVENAEPESF